MRMSGEAEDQAPDAGQAQTDPSPELAGTVLTTEQVSEFAEWLEARLDALDNRFHRFDQISTRNTRQVTEDMAELRSTVAHLHERVGQLISGNQKALKTLLQAEIRAALEQDRYALARAARRRTIRTFMVLFLIATGLVGAGLVWLDMVTPPWW